MAATTTDSRDFDVQILEETVRGHFAGKNAFMGSILASQGAIAINDSLPVGREFIGNEITVPYFGVIGDFVDNPEDTAVTPVALKSTNERATIGRSSLAFEVTKWARNSGPTDADPYVECAAQIEIAAQRRMDALCITAGAATPLVSDVYSASVPVYMSWDNVVDARAQWGDESDDIVAMVVHSRVEAGLRKLRDTNGRPLLLDSLSNGSKVTYMAGTPLVVSDRCPLDASSMGTVTEAGASVGGVGFTGTPSGAWDVRIRIIAGGARGTATFQFSTDGGNTYSATMTTAATVVLTDTASDSLVGNNGLTGLTATFGVATYNVLSVYSSKALLKATSLVLQRGAMAFYYNRAAMSLETDKDILKHNEVAAMHIYGVAHRYRRRRNGKLPGVVALKTNVPGFIG